MSSPEEVQRRLESLGQVDVSPADPGFVDRLGTDLRHRHADHRRSVGAVRVLLPVLAAAAMVLAVVLVASSAGLRDQDSGIADLPFTPTPTTTSTTTTTTTTTAPAPSSVPPSSPTTTQRTSPDTRTPATPPAQTTPTRPTQDATTTTTPPVPSTTTTTTTTGDAPTVRAEARRGDDGAVAVEWTIDRADAVAGWRIERRADGDRQATVVATIRDPTRRRIVDRPGVDAVVYSVIAVDGAGQTLGEARTRPV